MKRIVIILLVITFTALAFAQVVPVPVPTPVPVPDPGSNLGGFLGFVIDLFTRARYIPLLGALLVGTVSGIKLLAKQWPVLGNFVATRNGGYILNGVTAFAVTFGGALAGDVPVTWPLFVQALTVALAASAFNEIKKDTTGESPPSTGKPITILPAANTNQTEGKS